MSKGGKPQSKSKAQKPTSTHRTAKSFVPQRKKARPEEQIFTELGAICRSPGFVHALAYFCFRDSVVTFDESMQAADMANMFSAERLIRTEIITLYGLMIQGELNFEIPSVDALEHYVRTSEQLLAEIHNGMNEVAFAKIFPAKGIDSDANPFITGEALREAIFYSAESAYSHQYRDFLPLKYRADNEWLLANKGVYIEEIKTVIHAVSDQWSENAVNELNALRAQPASITLLPCFQFSGESIANRTGIAHDKVQRILELFSLATTPCNPGFTGLNEFNIVSATPLLKTPDGKYAMFGIYTLVEAAYDTPFYWMCDDQAYLPKAMDNRGYFTESFTADRLLKVFGKANVFSNALIFKKGKGEKSKGGEIAEIDVLVLFGERAIVLQAKSKRLTMEAKRGNDGVLKKDFKKAIQKAYEQAILCANYLCDPAYELRDSDGNLLEIPAKFKDIYPICAISDHYQALSFQAAHFLDIKSTPPIAPPFVMDIFLIDTMTEMLNSPLQLLSYIDRRCKYSNRIMASHELVILGYHLKNNLWFDDEMNLVMLHDDIAVDLDIAMAVRRDAVSGKQTPDGILTRFVDTPIGKIVHQIEAANDPAVIDLGFLILTLNSDTINSLDGGLAILNRQAAGDGKVHDVTIGLKDQSGLTIHFTSESVEIAAPRLEHHCTIRKYGCKAPNWYGVCIDPKDGSLRFGFNAEYPWKQNEQLEEAFKSMPTGLILNSQVLQTEVKSHRPGRNDPCLCGSGKKYKKCCLP